MTVDHPVQILDVTNRIFNTVLNNDLERGACVSPQTIALMVEEVKGIPYPVAYYPAMNTFENEKDEIASKVANLIVVGTVPDDTYAWYDAVVALDDAESIKDYNNLDEDYNVNYYTTMSMKRAECTFNHFDELRYFLNKCIKLSGEKK